MYVRKPWLYCGLCTARSNFGDLWRWGNLSLQWEIHQVIQTKLENSKPNLKTPNQTRKLQTKPENLKTKPDTPNQIKPNLNKKINLNQKPKLKLRQNKNLNQKLKFINPKPETKDNNQSQIQIKNFNSKQTKSWIPNHKNHKSQFNPQSQKNNLTWIPKQDGTKTQTKPSSQSRTISQ